MRARLLAALGSALGWVYVRWLLLWAALLGCAAPAPAQWTPLDMDEYWMEGGPDYAYPPLGYPVYQNGMRVYGGRGWSLWVLESGHVGPLVWR